MSAPEDDISDELEDAYRRASAAEAGRPSGATRAAILAEARAAAAARAAATPPKPTANEPWFSWRIVASLAVVGVALLVWRQLPREATRVLEAPQAPVTTAPVPDALPPAVKLEMPLPDVAAKDAPSPREERKAEKERAQVNVTDKPLPAAAPPPPPVIVDLAATQPVPESRADAAAAASSGRFLQEGVALRRAEPRPDFGALVRREFPALAQQAQPPTGVWLVLDSTGRTLRSGTLERGQSLGTVLTSLQRDLPDRRLRPFETGIVRVDSGATVLVGVARAE